MEMELHRLQNEIEEQIKKYNMLEKKAQQYTKARNNLYQQESENALVLREMQLLPQSVKIYKQVGGIMIDQTNKQAKTTISHRIGLIKSQIGNTQELIKKNEQQQKNMTQKIQKAKQVYAKMVGMMQQPQ